MQFLTLDGYLNAPLEVRKKKAPFFVLRFYPSGNLCLMISQMCWEAGKLGMEMSGFWRRFFSQRSTKVINLGTHPGTLDMTYLQLGKVKIGGKIYTKPWALQFNPGLFSVGKSLAKNSLKLPKNVSHEIHGISTSGHKRYVS